MAALAGKVVAIPVAHEYEDIELYYPLIRMAEAGAKVIVAAQYGGTHPRPFVGDKPITGRFGMPIPAPWLPEGTLYTIKPIDELQLEDFDALIIPGGFCPDILRRNRRTVQLVSEAVATGKVVAAICHGPWLLYSADVVRGKRITGFVAVKDDGLHAGGIWVDEPVVVDGNLITSRTPADLPAFCGAIIAALEAK